jgi:hypothetical protein
MANSDFPLCIATPTKIDPGSGEPSLKQAPSTGTVTSRAREGPLTLAGLRERGRSGLRPELLQRCVTLFFSSCDEQQHAYIGVVLRNGRQSSILFFT